MGLVKTFQILYVCGLLFTCIWSAGEKSTLTWNSERILGMNAQAFKTLSRSFKNAISNLPDDQWQSSSIQQFLGSILSILRRKLPVEVVEGSDSLVIPAIGDYEFRPPNFRNPCDPDFEHRVWVPSSDDNLCFGYYACVGCGSNVFTQLVESNDYRLHHSIFNTHDCQFGELEFGRLSHDWACDITQIPAGGSDNGTGRYFEMPDQTPIDTWGDVFEPQTDNDCNEPRYTFLAGTNGCNNACRYNCEENGYVQFSTFNTRTHMLGGAGGTCFYYNQCELKGPAISVRIEGTE